MALCLASLAACGGGSGSGDGPADQPPSSVVTTIDVSPVELFLNVNETQRLVATAYDQNGQVMIVAASGISWSSGGHVTTVDNGDVTAQIAGTDVVAVTISGVNLSVPVRVDPTIPDPATTPFLWPLKQEKSENSDALLSQDFREFGDGSTDKYHAGLDIRGDLGAPIFAPANGWVAFVQLDKTAGECPTLNCDHDMGNTVILGHVLQNGAYVYTLYSHLNKISDAILRDIGYTVNGSNIDENEDYSGLCYVDHELRRSTCQPWAVWVSRDSDVGEMGYTGFSSADRVHLHFEVKSEPLLSASNVSHEAAPWGYTVGDPLADNSGFSDPIYFLEIAGRTQAPYKVVVATPEALPLQLRMGPDGYNGDDTVGERPNIDGNYPAVDTLNDVITNFNVVGSALETSNCSDGWLQLERVDGSQVDDALADPPGRLRDVWACRGHNGTTYLAPPLDTEPPSRPTNLSATEVSANQIDLSWTPSTDNVVVAGYDIERNNAPLGIFAASPAYSDLAVEPSIEYCYTVSAFDFADNESSPRSDQACETLGTTSSFTVTMAPLVTSETDIPGRDGKFVYIQEASIDGDKIAFIGGTTSFYDGVFEIGPSGSVEIVADLNTPRPEQPSRNFWQYFDYVRVDGTDVLFRHIGDIYRAANGSMLSNVLDASGPAPGPVERSFGLVRELEAQGGDFAFTTSTGVYYVGPTGPQLVANIETIRPGIGSAIQYGAFRDPALHDGRVAFTGGGSGIDGVYDWTGSDISVISSSGQDHTNVALDDQRIVFSIEDASNTGEMWFGDGDGLRVEIARQEPNMRIADVFADNGHIAFSRRQGPRTGIFYYADGISTKIFDIGDTLDGREVHDFELEGLSGNTLVIVVRWSNSSADLYRAVISPN